MTGYLQLLNNAQSSIILSMEISLFQLFKSIKPYAIKVFCLKQSTQASPHITHRHWLDPRCSIRLQDAFAFYATAAKGLMSSAKRMKSVRVSVVASLSQLHREISPRDPSPTTSLFNQENRTSVRVHGEQRPTENRTRGSDNRWIGSSIGRRASRTLPRKLCCSFNRRKTDAAVRTKLVRVAQTFASVFTSGS